MLAASNFAAFCPFLAAYSTLDFTMSPLAGKVTWYLLFTTPSMLPTASDNSSAFSANSSSSNTMETLIATGGEVMPVGVSPYGRSADVLHRKSLNNGLRNQAFKEGDIGVCGVAQFFVQYSGE